MTLPYDAVYAMDCLQGLSQLSSHTATLVFADLPYEMTQNAWDHRIPMAPLWEQLNRVCVANAAKVFTAIQPFTSLVVCSALEQFRYSMVWEKNKASGHLNAKKQPLRSHEDILVFYSKQPCYVAQKTEGHRPMNFARRVSYSPCYGKQAQTQSDKGTRSRYPTTLLRIPVVNNDDPDRCHPNQKPDALSEWFIRTYTKPGELVVDPACGSGSTLRAAKRLGRRFIGFDTDKDMVAQVQARLTEVRVQ